MRLSCTDSTFPKLSHRAALSVIADLGIPCVDLCVFGVDGHHFIRPEAVVSDSVEAALDARRRVEDAGLVVCDVFVVLGGDFAALAVNHPDEAQRRESRQQCLRMFEFAAAAGAPGVTLLPGIAWPGEDPNVSRHRAADELQWRATRAATHGLQLSIEAHVESIVETPDQVLELLASAPGVRLTLDPGHFVYQGFTDSDVDVLIPFARHVQARQAAPGLLQTRLDDGTIDFVRFLHKLEAAGYSGCFGLEYQWDDWLECNRVDCIAETACLRDLVLAVGSDRDRSNTVR